MSECQGDLSEQKPSRIISISQKISQVDPLTVLHQFAQPQHLSFYFEKKDRATDHSVAIAAFGTTAHLQIEGKNRFQLAQEFISENLSSDDRDRRNALALDWASFFLRLYVF